MGREETDFTQEIRTADRHYELDNIEEELGNLENSIKSSWEWMRTRKIKEFKGYDGEFKPASYNEDGEYLELFVTSDLDQSVSLKIDPYTAKVKYNEERLESLADRREDDPVREGAETLLEYARTRFPNKKQSLGDKIHSVLE